MIPVDPVSTLVSWPLSAVPPLTAKRIWIVLNLILFFFSSRRRHTRLQGDWSSDVCSSDLMIRHTRLQGDWSSDVCSSDLMIRHTRLQGDWSSDVCSSD